MRLPPASLPLTLGFFVGLALAACVDERENPEHCSKQAGDASCAARFPEGDRPHCANLSCSDAAWGCVAEPPEPSCYSPCGAGATADEDASCLDGAGTDTGTDTSTDEGPSCTSDEDCADPMASFCVDGECSSCDATPDPNAACVETSAGELPVCAGGACVQCTPEAAEACMGETPACDPETNTCEPCSFHDQCPSACDRATGSCLPEDRIWHVDGDGGQDFPTIPQALLQIPMGESGTIVVHERSGGTAYAIDTVFSEGRTVALLAAPGEAPFIDAQMTIDTGAVVYMQGLDVRGFEPVIVDAATLYLDETQVMANVLSAVRLDNDARLYARNAMLKGANSMDLSGPAVAATGSRFELLYSTAVAYARPALECTSGAGSSVRNSIVLNDSLDSAVACDALPLLNSAMDDATDFPGNVSIGELDLAWFVSEWNYHLSDAAPVEIETAAQWQAGDPPADIDGDPRVSVVGEPGFAGADLRTP